MSPAQFHNIVSIEFSQRSFRIRVIAWAHITEIARAYLTLISRLQYKLEVALE